MIPRNFPVALPKSNFSMGFRLKTDLVLRAVESLASRSQRGDLIERNDPNLGNALTAYGLFREYRGFANGATLGHFRPIDLRQILGKTGPNVARRFRARFPDGEYDLAGLLAGAAEEQRAHPILWSDLLLPSGEYPPPLIHEASVIGAVVTFQQGGAGVIHWHDGFLMGTSPFPVEVPEFLEAGEYRWQGDLSHGGCEVQAHRMTRLDPAVGTFRQETLRALVTAESPMVTFYGTDVEVPLEIALMEIYQIDPQQMFFISPHRVFEASDYTGPIGRFPMEFIAGMVGQFRLQLADDQPSPRWHLPFAAPDGKSLIAAKIAWCGRHPSGLPLEWALELTGPEMPAKVHSFHITRETVGAVERHLTRHLHDQRQIARFLPRPVRRSTPPVTSLAAEEVAFGDPILN